MVLRTAADVAPDAMAVTEHRLHDVPLYDADVEERGDPAGVAALKEAVAGADGVLIVTPEYQHGIPGVLKNALDWASRPPGGSPLQGKKVAVMGATPGMTATARAQTQLRQTLVYNACLVLPPPEVLIARVHDKVDEERGRLVDDTSQRFVAEALERFARWIRDAPPPP
jgi:chromate reductase